MNSKKAVQSDYERIVSESRVEHNYGSEPVTRARAKDLKVENSLAIRVKKAVRGAAPIAAVVSIVAGTIGLSALYLNKFVNPTVGVVKMNENYMANYEEARRNYSKSMHDARERPDGEEIPSGLGTLLGDNTMIGQINGRDAFFYQNGRALYADNMTEVSQEDVFQWVQTYRSRSNSRTLDSKFLGQ